MILYEVLFRLCCTCVALVGWIFTSITSTGLVEIEVLHQLEVMTGKSIPELFDWVVATSTGAIIILGMLYGM